jgi:hypothetical protein
VDSVAFELKMMQKALTRKTEGLDAVREADDRLLQLLNSELGDEHADLIEEVKRIHRRKQPLLDEAIDHADDELEAVDDVRQKMTQITMSLQVQDITSQQIAAANHIIESLRDRMTRLVEHPGIRLGDADTPAATDAPDAPNAPPDDSDGTFDGNAQYDPKGSHQSVADALIDSIKDGSDVEATTPPPDPAAPSSDEGAASDEDADAPDPDALPGGDGEIAQEDIDELFS